MIKIAYLKIIDIHVTMEKAINYILNEDKFHFVKFQNCIEGLSSFQMELTKRKFDKNRGVLGHHIIQPFVPGEVDQREFLKWPRSYVKQN